MPCHAMLCDGSSSLVDHSQLGSFYLPASTGSCSAVLPHAFPFRALINSDTLMYGWMLTKGDTQRKARAEEGLKWKKGFARSIGRSLITYCTVKEVP